jgi:hypothetical protein
MAKHARMKLNPRAAIRIINPRRSVWFINAAGGCTVGTGEALVSDMMNRRKPQNKKGQEIGRTRSLRSDGEGRTAEANYQSFEPKAKDRARVSRIEGHADRLDSEDVWH